MKLLSTRCDPVIGQSSTHAIQVNGHSAAPHNNSNPRTCRAVPSRAHASEKEVQVSTFGTDIAMRTDCLNIEEIIRKMFQFIIVKTCLFSLSKGPWRLIARFRFDRLV